MKHGQSPTRPLILPLILPLIRPLIRPLITRDAMGCYGDAHVVFSVMLSVMLTRDSKGPVRLLGRGLRHCLSRHRTTRYGSLPTLTPISAPWGEAYRRTQYRLCNRGGPVRFPAQRGPLRLRPSPLCCLSVAPVSSPVSSSVSCPWRRFWRRKPHARGPFLVALALDGSKYPPAPFR